MTTLSVNQSKRSCSTRDLQSRCSCTCDSEKAAVTLVALSLHVAPVHVPSPSRSGMRGPRSPLSPGLAPASLAAEVHGQRVSCAQQRQQAQCAADASCAASKRTPPVPNGTPLYSKLWSCDHQTTPFVPCVQAVEGQIISDYSPAVPGRLSREREHLFSGTQEPEQEAEGIYDQCRDTLYDYHVAWLTVSASSYTFMTSSFSRSTVTGSFDDSTSSAL